MPAPSLPPVVDRAAWRAARDELLVGRRRTPARATRSPPLAAGCR